MTAKTKSVSEKLELAQNASQTGQLSNYAPAKLSDGADPKQTKSWGPAMRR